MSRTHCMVVDLVHSPGRARGSSPFVLARVDVDVLLGIRLGLEEGDRRSLDEHLQWLWTVPVRGTAGRTLTIVRFWSNEGFVANILISPSHFPGRFWPAMPNWFQFLS